MAVRDMGGFEGLPAVPALMELMLLPRWVCWRHKTMPNGKRTKVPFQARTAFPASTNKPETWSTYAAAAEAARRRGDPGVGFVLNGEGGYVGIDLDDCIGPDGDVLPWAQEILDFGETYAEITPSGNGLRLIGRAEDVETIARGKECQVEVYTSGRYLTITGDQVDGSPDAIDQVPLSLDALVARVEAWKASRPAAVPRSGPVHHADGQTELAEMEELLRFIPASTGYAEWLEVLMGIHSATGGSGAGLDLADAWSAGGGDSYGGRAEVEKKWRSFNRTGVTGATVAEVARRYGADLSEIAIRHKIGEISAFADDGFDPDQMAVPRAANDAGQKIAAIPTPKDRYVEPEWCRASGIIGEMADWILSTSRQPNRPLAVAAATSIVGAVCGRHIATPTMCGTHLYIACIGQTSIGKDRPLKAMFQILDAAGLPDLAQTAKFKSDSALEKALVSYPSHVAIADEIGHTLLAKISHGRASTHEAGLGPLLRELWSTSFETLTLSARAGDISGSPTKLTAPAFSIFGASTTGQFYSSLGSNSIESGTLNRFTIIRTAPRTEARDVDPRSLRSVPDRIATALYDLLPEAPPTRGVALGAGVDAHRAHSMPEVHVVPWADESVRESFMAYGKAILKKIDQRESLANYIGRTAEMAIRLATIHAVSCLGRNAAVRQKDLEWGIAISDESAAVMIEDAQEHVHESDAQARYMLVRRIIKKRGKATRKEITKAAKGRIQSREMDGILNDLDESGFAVKSHIKTAGRSLSVYTYNKGYEDDE